MNNELKLAIEADEMVWQTWPTIKLAGYRGSVAHGTAGDVIDDVDIIGVFIAPDTHYYGLTHFEHVERIAVAGKYDFALFELRKYFKLLLKANPNVLSLLWLPEDLYFVKEGWGQWLVENRQLFMTKMLHKTFGGYAYGQIKRMTRCCTDQAYQGSKRKARYEKFGYDCKNAAHVIRILRMGIEALLTGEIQVVRNDAGQLKDIKYGKWKLEWVVEESNKLMALLDKAYGNSNLPDSPNYKKAEGVLMDILKTELNK